MHKTVCIEKGKWDYIEKNFKMAVGVSDFVHFTGNVGGACVSDLEGRENAFGYAAKPCTKSCICRIIKPTDGSARN